MRGLALLALVAAAGVLPAPATAQTALRRRRRTPDPALSGHFERLAARAQAGDREARRLLVDEHMPLVRALARRYRDLGLPLEDLTQEGAIGVLEAIVDFDPGRGTSFSTYAFWRARAEITHALTARGHIVRLPRPLLERRREVAHAHRSLAATGREPTLIELATATGHTPDEVDEALSVQFHADSLDGTSDESVRKLPFVSTDDAAGEFAAARERTAVHAAVARLTGRKREIIRRHFGFGGPPESLTRIASDLELSPARTRALKDAALHELAVELEPTLAA